MKFTHPNGQHDLIVVQGTALMAEVELPPLPGWVTIGQLGGGGQIIIDKDEWPAFKALVAEIDEALK
jgi:hypothetical protein